VKWKLPEWWGVEDKHPQWNVLPGGWTAFKILPISARPRHGHAQATALKCNLPDDTETRESLLRLRGL
jgi:hypothetical protein